MGPREPGTWKQAFMRLHEGQSMEGLSNTSSTWLHEWHRGDRGSNPCSPAHPKMIMQPAHKSRFVKCVTVTSFRREARSRNKTLVNGSCKTCELPSTWVQGTLFASVACAVPAGFRLAWTCLLLIRSQVHAHSLGALALSYAETMCPCPHLLWHISILQLKAACSQCSSSQASSHSTGWKPVP